MDRAAFQFMVAAVLPYPAVVVFVAASLYRLVLWKRLPQPVTMTLFPTGGSGIGPLAREAFFLPSLYRGDRFLWTLAWSFHVTLALALIGHARIATGLLDRALGIAGVGSGAVAALSSLIGGASGFVLLVALAGFLGRRLLVRRVREISTAPDFVALLLLAAVITSGNLMRWFGGPDELVEARAWFASLRSFAPLVPRNAGLLVHVFCAEVLLVYVGFSKLMHFGGFFLTFSLTKRTDP